MQNAMRRSTLVLPADVAKLADAQDSGSCGVTPMEVRFLSSALKSPTHVVGLFVYWPGVAATLHPTLDM